MEFTYFLAGLALAVVYCLYKIWELHVEGRQDSLKSGVVDLGRADSTKSESREASDKTQSRQELQDVPVPWGWPGNSAYHGARSSKHGRTEPGSIHHFVDHLVREKQTTRDEAYQQRLEASMKALLEDRYHSPGQPDRPSNGSKGPPGQ